MKIFFSASSDVSPTIKDDYVKIIKLMGKLGYKVTQSIFSPISNKKISRPSDFEDIYSNVIKKIDQSDILVADISYPSGGVGYQIYHALYQKKPIIIIYTEDKGTNPSVIIRGINSEKVSIYKYTNLEDLSRELPNLLTSASRHTKVRFNLVLKNQELVFLNRQARKLGISTTHLIRRILINYRHSFQVDRS